MINTTTLITNSSFNFSSITEVDTCMTGTKYSIECLHRLICPQLNSYFIRTGIILVISYIVIGWLLWWFLNYGYKYTSNEKHKHIGNFHDLETRIYWDTWVRARLSNVMLFYIVIVIWFNLS